MKGLNETLLQCSEIPDYQDTDAVNESKNKIVEHSYRDSRRWTETLIKYVSLNYRQKDEFPYMEEPFSRAPFRNI